MKAKRQAVNDPTIPCDDRPITKGGGGSYIFYMHDIDPTKTGGKNDLESELKSKS